MMPLDHRSLRAAADASRRGGTGARDGRAVALFCAVAVHVLLALVLLWAAPDAVIRRAEPGIKLFLLPPVPAEPAPEPAHPVLAGPADAARPPARMESPAPVPPPPAAAASAPEMVAAPVAPAVQPRLDLPAPVPQPPAARPDQAALLADYERSLWAAIARHKPRGASLRGTVRVRFRLDATGALLSADVAESSGLALLDQLALRAVRAAAPFPAPPAGVDPAALLFRIPLDFR